MFFNLYKYSKKKYDKSFQGWSNEKSLYIFKDKKYVYP